MTVSLSGSRGFDENPPLAVLLRQRYCNGPFETGFKAEHFGALLKETKNEGSRDALTSGSSVKMKKYEKYYRLTHAEILDRLCMTMEKESSQLRFNYFTMH